MFTGIIRSVGEIRAVESDSSARTRHLAKVSDSLSIGNDIKCVHFEIFAPEMVQELNKGASIALDGVCLTVTNIAEDHFSVDVMPETLRCTNFIHKKSGNKVNLEPTLRFSDGLDGHFVLGHVDGVGTVREIQKKGDDVLFTIEFPKHLSKYIAHKGSIAINGVSLTIQDVTNDILRVALIPYTLEHTNLGSLKKDDIVNIEVDVCARYLEKLFHEKT